VTSAFGNNPKDRNFNVCEMLEIAYINMYMYMLIVLKKYLQNQSSLITNFLLNVDKMAMNTKCNYSFGISSESKDLSCLIANMLYYFIEFTLHTGNL
jgi:hypothetical protein